MDSDFVEIAADLIQTGGKWLFSIAFLNSWKNVAIFVFKKHSHYSLSSYKQMEDKAFQGRLYGPRLGLRRTEI